MSPTTKRSLIDHARSGKYSASGITVRKVYQGFRQFGKVDNLRDAVLHVANRM